MSDHLGTLCIKGLTSISPGTKLEVFSKTETWTTATLGFSKNKLTKSWFVKYGFAEALNCLKGASQE